MQSTFDDRADRADDLLRYQRVLWLEVVATAMRDTLPESKPRIRDEAMYWLLHSKDFHVICGLAGLDSGYLRNMMAARCRAGSILKDMRERGERRTGHGNQIKAESDSPTPLLPDLGVSERAILAVAATSGYY